MFCAGQRIFPCTLFAACMAPYDELGVRPQQLGCCRVAWCSLGVLDMLFAPMEYMSKCANACECGMGLGDHNAVSSAGTSQACGRLRRGAPSARTGTTCAAVPLRRPSACSLAVRITCALFADIHLSAGENLQRAHAVLFASRQTTAHWHKTKAQRCAGR